MNYVVIPGVKKTYGSFRRSNMDAEIILGMVCGYFRVSRSAIISRHRSSRVVEPRMIAMYLIRKYVDMPYKTIGDMFGYRDHSSVFHMCKKVKDFIYIGDEKIFKIINDLTQEYEGGINSVIYKERVGEAGLVCD